MYPSLLVEYHHHPLLLPLIQTQGKEQSLTALIYKVCTPTDDGEGPPDCEQSCYYHNGESGFSCSDQACFFDPDNFCSVSENGQIITPFGDGNWVADSTCSEDNEQGAYAGSIISPNGGSDWACSCLNAPKGITGSNECGEEYACTEVWSCTCSKCNA